MSWAPPKTLVQATAGNIPKTGGEKAIVTYVGDGDGASLKRKDGSVVNCRLDKIDAPETAHPKQGKPAQTFGEEAKKTLQQMIENKEVTLSITKPSDKYGRALCQIHIEGADVNLEMVKKGAAWLYTRYSNDPVFADAQNTAKANKVGLWADKQAEYPEAFKNRQR